VDLTTLVQLVLFGLVWGALYALIAIGLNVIYGVMKILNIAHGEFLMLGAYLTYWLFTLLDISPLVSIPLAAVTMFAFGVLIFQLIIKPLHTHGLTIERYENATLIIFFGVLLVIQNVAKLLWSSDYRSVTYLTQPVHLGGVSVATNRLLVAAVALILTAAIYIGQRHTLVGKAIRAVSQDRDTAKLMGIDVNRIDLLGFGIGSALAGIAGSLVSTIYVITPTIGLLFTIKAFTVMVVGGLGNQIGTLVAALALGVMESLASFVIGPEFKDITGYVLLIGFILLKARTSAALRSEVK
jgi:branched-chain amino acid transport system permease protein